MKSVKFTIIIVLMTKLFTNCTCGVPDLHSCIKNTKSSIEVVTHGNSSYETLNYSQNIRKVVNPKGFIVVHSSVDVKVAIKCLVKLKLKFAVKCGGHSYEQYSYGSNNNDWVIDLSALKSFEIDKKNFVATVGSGFRARELTQMLWENGQFGLSFGTCGDIGISGYTLGGGIGMTCRKNGLMIDRVLEMEVVKADGTIVRANKTFNSNLFWALLGAGGSNFGIVTKFKYKVYDASSNVYTVVRNFEISNFVHYFTIWQHLVESKPDNSLSAEFACLLGSCSFATVIASNELDVRERTLNKLKKIFEDLKDDEITSQTHIEMLTKLDVYTFDYYLKATSFFVSKSLSDNEINRLYVALSKPTSGVYFSLNILGGMVNVPSANSMAFCHRNSSYIVQFGVGNVVTDPSLVDGIRTEAKAAEHFVPEFLTDTKFMNNGESYQNYIDAGLPNWLQRYYCSNIFDLISLKRQHDPNNVFQFKQSIPQTLPSPLFLDYLRNLMSLPVSYVRYIGK